MKNKTEINYLIFSLIMLALILPSCQQRQQPLESNEMMTADSFHIFAVEVIPSYHNISDLSLLLKNVDVSYYPELVNSIENVERYHNNDLLKAANMGVYMVDLAYSYSFGDDNAAAGSYLSAMTLAHDFKEVMTFINNLMADFTVNELELDTILLKLEQNLQVSLAYLTGDEEIRLYSALLTGTFVENIFLLYSTISQYPDDSAYEDQQIENLQRLIWIATGQKKTLEELNKIIDDYAIPEEYQLHHHQLIDLEEQMEEAVFLKDTSIVHSVEMVRNPEFISLYDEIMKIRGSITEPEE